MPVLIHMDSIDVMRKKNERKIWNRIARIYDSWIEKACEDQYVVFQQISSTRGWRYLEKPVVLFLRCRKKVENEPPANNELNINCNLAAGFWLTMTAILPINPIEGFDYYVVN